MFRYFLSKFLFLFFIKCFLLNFVFSMEDPGFQNQTRLDIMRPKPIHIPPRIFDEGQISLSPLSPYPRPLEIDEIYNDFLDLCELYLMSLIIFYDASSEKDLSYLFLANFKKDKIKKEASDYSIIRMLNSFNEWVFNLEHQFIMAQKNLSINSILIPQLMIKNQILCTMEVIGIRELFSKKRFIIQNVICRDVLKGKTIEECLAEFLNDGSLQSSYSEDPPEFDEDIG